MTQGPLWRELVSRLEQEIRAGVRAPGSKLPSIAEQQTAGLSQTTTLRAYQELVRQGLAVTVQGTGTYVAQPLPPMEPEVTLSELAERVRRIEDHLKLRTEEDG